jgi:hypothetical protein
MSDPLTREQILSLSGAALDAAVAERCFGWKRREYWWIDSKGDVAGFCQSSSTGYRPKVFLPSASWAACEQVV